MLELHRHAVSDRRLEQDAEPGPDMSLEPSEIISNLNPRHEFFRTSQEPQAMSKHPIAGSDKSQPEGARCLGACNPDEQIEVVVMLRRQTKANSPS